MERTTWLPAAPFMRRVASPRGISFVEAPSTATIRSPARMPARSAGESAMGATTTIPSATWLTSSPTPSNSPVVSSRMDR